jgi:hypothetical protein
MKAKLKWQEYNEYFKANVSRNGANCSFTPDAIVEVTPIGMKNDVPYVSVEETDSRFKTFCNVPERFIDYKVFSVSAPQDEA